MIKLAIYGAKGKMGQMLTQIAKNHKDYQIDVCYLLDSQSDENQIIIALKNADIIIDFSLPDGTKRLLKCAKDCTNIRAGLVICTTGNDNNFEQMDDLSKTIKILYAPNTSIGAQLTARLSGILAQILSGYNIDIIDIHHNQKKDKPSGTAKMIREKICGDDVNIVSLRSGGIFGKHIVQFAGEDEVITISHEALSRKLFARGAIDAGHFLLNAKPGKLYMMDDILANI